MLDGSSHIAGGNGGAANAGAIAIVDIIKANRKASILRDFFIFVLHSPFFCSHMLLGTSSALNNIREHVSSEFPLSGNAVDYSE
jgi:hypothetical protein